MEWDTEFAVSIVPRLLEGVIITLQATLLGSLFAFSFGLVLAVLRLSTGSVVSGVVYWISEFIRRTPLLVQLYFRRCCMELALPTICPYP